MLHLNKYSIRLKSKKMRDSFKTFQNELNHSSLNIHIGIHFVLEILFILDFAYFYFTTGECTTKVRNICV